MPNLTGLTTNFFPTPNEGFTTTTSGPVDSSSATVVPLNSVSGLTNGSIYTGLIDPGNAKKRAFTGVVDTGGSQITNVVFTTGTNATHTTGATVVDYVTGTHIGQITKGISVSIDPDGTLKAGAVDNAAVLASNVVTTAKILDDNVTDAKLDYPRWWQEIGRTTLGSAGDTISVTGIPARKYLKFILSYTSTGGTTVGTIRFNNDSGNNYANRQSANGGADATATSQSGFQMSSAEANISFYGEFEGLNVSTLEKVFVGRVTKTATSGAGTAPNRTEDAVKWVNTSAQINRIDVINGGTGDFATGAELIVLGHD